MKAKVHRRKMGRRRAAPERRPESTGFSHVSRPMVVKRYYIRIFVVFPFAFQ